MNTLPPELLGMIADSIQQNPRPFQRQRTLAALARTNKIFYLICNPRLYLTPTLCRENKRKWIRFYLSKVNAFTLAQSSTDLRSVVVPNSIPFKNGPARADDNDHDDDNQPVFRRLDGPAQENWLLTIAFKTNIFRNLTRFSVSRFDHLDLDFIAALFGPLGTNRSTIRKLVVYLPGYSSFSAFLVEALNRTEWFWWEEDLPDVYSKLLSQRITDEISEEEEERRPSDQEFQAEARQLAAVQYSFFNSMCPVTEEPLAILQQLALRDRHSLCHPFTLLHSLTLFISDAFDLYLLFYSDLFPTLRKMNLGGFMEVSTTLEHDVKLLRHSITKLRGSISPPDYDENATDAFDDIGGSWEPLSEEEIESVPKIAYFGPNLSELDLSELLLEFEVE